MPDPIYYHFTNLGIVLCVYHKDKLLEKEPKAEYEIVEPGFQLVSEWCNSCTDVIIQYEKEVD